MEQKEKTKSGIFWIITCIICGIMVLLGIYCRQQYGISVGLDGIGVMFLLIVTAFLDKKEKDNIKVRIMRYLVLLMFIFITLLIQGVTTNNMKSTAIAVVSFVVMLFVIFIYKKRYSIYKAFQKNMEYFNNTRDAEGYKKKWEELYETGKKKKWKNLWSIRFNIASAMVQCGEHEAAEAAFVQLLKELEEKNPQYETMVSVIAYNRMWNDVFTKNYAHMKQLVEENSEVFAKMKEDEKTKTTAFFLPFFLALAEKNFEKAYEELKAVQNNTELVIASPCRENIDFFEVLVLQESGCMEESREKAEILAQNAKVACVLQQMKK